MKRIFGILAVITMVLPLQATAQDGTVARAQFTSGILDREPVDSMMTLDSQTDRVFFFTELRNMEGRTVVHRWELNGEVMAAVTFDVRGPRWRIYSSKELLPEWTGAWQVSVVDETGTVLDSEMLNYASN